MPRANQLQPADEDLDNLPPDPPDPDEIEEPEDEVEIEEPEEHPESEIERQARLLGWHPKEEYLGPPHRWKSAEEFMQQGQNVLPILRDNNKRLLERADKQGEEIRELKKTLADQTTILNDMRKMARTADERGYQRAMAELKSQQREAAASGDVERFDQVSEQIEETIKARVAATDAPPAPRTEEPPRSGAPQEVVNFVNTNPWYNNDPELNRRMNAEHEYLLRTEPELSLSENLTRAAQRVKQAFPAKFPRPNGAGSRPAPARVATPSGSRGGPTPRPKSAFDVIDDVAERAQAKEQYARFKRQWPDYTESEFMEIYSDPHADVLAMQKQAREKSRGK